MLKSERKFPNDGKRREFVLLDVAVESSINKKSFSLFVPKGASLLEATQLLPNLKIKEHALGKWVTALEEIEERNDFGWQFYIKGGLPYVKTNNGPAFLSIENIKIDHPISVVWKYENYTQDIVFSRGGGCSGKGIDIGKIFTSNYETYKFQDEKGKTTFYPIDTNHSSILLFEKISKKYEDIKQISIDMERTVTTPKYHKNSEEKGSNFEERMFDHVSRTEYFLSHQTNFEEGIIQQQYNKNSDVTLSNKCDVAESRMLVRYIDNAVSSFSNQLKPLENLIFVNNIKGKLGILGGSVMGNNHSFKKLLNKLNEGIQISKSKLSKITSEFFSRIMKAVHILSSSKHVIFNFVTNFKPFVKNVLNNVVSKVNFLLKSIVGVVNFIKNKILGKSSFKSKYFVKIFEKINATGHSLSKFIGTIGNYFKYKVWTIWPFQKIMPPTRKRLDRILWIILFFLRTRSILYSEQLSVFLRFLELKLYSYIGLIKLNKRPDGHVEA